MGYLFAIIIGIGLIWAVYAFTNRKESKEPGKQEGLKIGPSVTTIEEKPTNEEKKTQRSLDEVYAESTNSWVCSHCETINPHSRSTCAACGRKNEMITGENK